MLKKVIVSLILFIFLTVAQLSSTTLALSCVEQELPHIAFEHYDGVIIGHVKSVKKRMNDKVITVEVEKSFKGVTAKELKIVEDFTWGQSEESNTYLYFLKQEKQGWTNPLCSPTTSDISLADQYLADKAELPLQANEQSIIQQTPIIILAIIILSIIVPSIIIYYKKKED